VALRYRLKLLKPRAPAQIKALDWFAHNTLQALHHADAIALRVAGLRQHEDEKKRRAEGVRRASVP
jgi:hypothetical protein